MSDLHFISASTVGTAFSSCCICLESNASIYTLLQQMESTEYTQNPLQCTVNWSTNNPLQLQFIESSVAIYIYSSPAHGFHWIYTVSVDLHRTLNLHRIHCNSQTLNLHRIHCNAQTLNLHRIHCSAQTLNLHRIHCNAQTLNPHRIHCNAQTLNPHRIHCSAQTLNLPLQCTVTESPHRINCSSSS